MKTDFDKILQWVKDQEYRYESSEDDEMDYGVSEYVMVDLPVNISKNLDDDTDRTSITFCFEFEINSRNIKNILIGNVVNIPCTDLIIDRWRDEFRLELSPSNSNIYIGKAR